MKQHVAALCLNVQATRDGVAADTRAVRLSFCTYITGHVRTAVSRA